MEFNSNEEHPVEQHVRRDDTGPMPESYATYRTRHDRRIHADAHNEGWAGTCRVRDIAMARDAMRSILQHRSQRARLDNPELSQVAIQRERSTETRAIDGITEMIGRLSAALPSEGCPKRETVGKTHQLARLVSSLATNHAWMRQCWREDGSGREQTGVDARGPAGVGRSGRERPGADGSGLEWTRADGGGREGTGACGEVR
jgi:hypothetical protein